MNKEYIKLIDLSREYYEHNLRFKYDTKSNNISLLQLNKEGATEVLIENISSELIDGLTCITVEYYNDAILPAVRNCRIFT